MLFSKDEKATRRRRVVAVGSSSDEDAAARLPRAEACSTASTKSEAQRPARSRHGGFTHGSGTDELNHVQESGDAVVVDVDAEPEKVYNVEEARSALRHLPVDERRTRGKLWLYPELPSLRRIFEQASVIVLPKPFASILINPYPLELLCPQGRPSRSSKPRWNPGYAITYLVS